MPRDVPVHETISPAPSGRANLVVDFCEGGQSSEYKVAGWSRESVDGSRTLGTRSTLRLPRPGVSGDYSLLFKVKPFSVGDRSPHHRVGVLVNGQRVASVVVRAKMDLEVWLPWSVIGGHDDLEIELDLPDAERPSVLGESTDRRILALIVRSVALRRLVKGLAASTGTVMREHPERFKDLMLNFISLGTNCELGLMQRMCGAEPLGLFRFAATPLDGLLRALGSGFAGMGEPSQTVLYLSQSGEYLVRDRRYNIRYHTGVRPSHASEEVVAVQQQQRLRYLARKMTEELQRGDNIFVFRSDDPVEREDIRDLFAQLRRYGDNTLLWIVEDTVAESCGRVGWLEDGLIRASIDKLARTDIERDISFEGWVVACEKALRLRKRGWHPRPSQSSGFTDGSGMPEVSGVREAGSQRLVGLVEA